MVDDCYIPSVIPMEDRETHRRGGLARRVGFGRKLAILVVDMTRYIVEDRSPLWCGEAGLSATQAIARLLDTARPIGIPVIYSTQRMSEPYSAATGGRLMDKVIAPDSDFAQASWPHEIVDDLAPAPEDTVLDKPKPSVFFGTQLASLLIFHNVDTLIVTGATTSGCIRATVDHAAAFNLRVIVPYECVADRFTLSHQVTLFDIDSWLGDVVSVEAVLDHLRAIDRSVYA